MDDSTASSSVETAATEADEPRWPATFALFTAWPLPATTARRTSHVSLGSAWLVHLFAALVSIASVAYLRAWSHAGSLNLGGMLLGLGELLYSNVRDDPVWTSPTLMGVVLLVEVGFLAVALLIMPWGARDEPLWESYRHALRQTWLRTAQVVPAVFIVGILAVSLTHIRADWVGRNPNPATISGLPVPPTPPAVLPSDPSYAQATADYRAAQWKYDREIREWRRLRAEWRQRQPWYVRHHEEIVVHTAFLAGLWILWALFRAVGASRRTPYIARPPTCETCGYNLTTLTLESRCPECGDPVVESLGPDARPGSPWSRRSEMGSLVAWWQCIFEPVRRPRDFGRRLRVLTPETSHRWFFAMHLPLIYMIGIVGLLSGMAVTRGGREALREQLVLMLFTSSLFGVACVIGTLAVTLLAALLMGIHPSITHRRNLLPGSMQVASYQIGYLVVWALFGAALGALMFALVDADFFEEVFGPSIEGGVLALLTWFIVNVACGVHFLFLVGRGTAGTRFANR